MPQIIECPKCAKKLNAPDKLAGMRVACPACQSAVSIPPIKVAPNQQAHSRPVNSPSRNVGAATPTTAQSAFIIQCPHCTKKFKGSAQLQGKSIRCPACSNDFTVRLQAIAAPARKSSPAAKPTATSPFAKPPAGPTSARTPGKPASTATTQQPVRPLASPLTANTQSKPVVQKKPSVPTPARTLKFSSGRPRMLYLVFAFAFVPLVFQTLNTKSDLE